MVSANSLVRIVILAASITFSCGKPHVLSTRTKRQEILPQSPFFNPGSAENARLSFEDQNAEPANSQNENQVENNALFEGYQNSNSIEREAAAPNDREAQDFQREYLSESEIQNAQVGDAAANQGSERGEVDAALSNENLAEFNKQGMSDEAKNPFEMPAGYPVGDGYKKSFVAKQKLPFHEYHPDTAILTHENDTWYGVSRYPPTRRPPSNYTDHNVTNPAVMAGISMNPNARPAQYKVSVSGSQNPNGYVTASQVEATYPYAQPPAIPPPNAAQSAPSPNAGQLPYKPNQATIPVEYAVPPPQQNVEGKKLPSDAKQQKEEPQSPQGVKLPPSKLNLQPVKEQDSNDILDIKLEQRPVKLEPSSSSEPVAQPYNPAAAPQPQPGPQKVPSAKNYPIDLILLKEQPLLGIKPEQTGGSNQMASAQGARPVANSAPNQYAQSPAVQPVLSSSAPYNAIQPQQAYAQQRVQPAQQNQQYQEGNQSVVDDPRCVQYPLTRCREEWLKKNCQLRCKGQNTTCSISSSGGTGNNGCCSFPFIYMGQPYYNCILNPGQFYWCGTTLNFDKDRLWGYCSGCPFFPCPINPTAQPPISVYTTNAPYTNATTATAAPTRSSTTQAATTSSTTAATAPPTSVTKATTQDTTLQTTTSTQPKTIQTTQSTRATTKTANTTQRPLTTTQKPATTANTPATLSTPKPYTLPPLGCEQWSEWSKCDKNCIGGKMSRFRNCTRAFLVKTIEVEEKSCNNTNSCDIACGNWTQWSECSATCGYGFKQRFKNCSINGHLKVFVDRKYCYTADCPADCKPWTSWSECSKSCGKGNQTRYRNCTLTDGIESFSRVFYEQRACNPDPCLPDCNPWSSWSPCTMSCGEGTQYRQTKCKLDSGANMTYFEHRVCNVLDCPPVCEAWGNWSECTRTCGGGSQLRARNCSIFSHGKNKTFEEGEVQDCNTQPCEPKIFCNEWGPWTECSATCGGGQMMHVRQCTREDGFTFFQNETVACNTQQCERVCGEWSAYTMCSKSCGGGISERWRTCNGEVEFDSVACNTFPCTTIAPTTKPGPPVSTPSPSPQECTAWSNWSECSATCNGLQSRVRHCKNNTHEHDELEARPCNTLPCPAATTPTATPVTSPSTKPPSTTPTSASSTPSTGTTPKPRPGPYPECLLAYLSFDKVDSQRKIVYDEGPYHNDAQLDGNLTFVNGNFTCGYAVKLSGGEILFDGSKFSPKPVSAVTVAAWVFIESNTDRQTIFATRAGGSDHDNFFLEIEQGKIRWYHIDTAGKTVFFVVTESLLPAKTWVHVAGSYSVQTGEVRFFINAEESKLSMGKGPLTQDWDAYAKIASGGTGNQFKGIIDEFYIFNCSLVDEQIRVIADTCKLREGDECPSPLLGICPPCDNCTTAAPPTTKPQIEEPSMVSANLQNNKFALDANLAPQPVQQSAKNFLSAPAKTMKEQTIQMKNFKGLVSTQFGNYGSDKQGKAMVARSNFVFPWLKTVELYRKKRDSI